jgi:cytochrome c oxidase subunit II
MSAGLVGLMIGVALFAGIHRATMPQVWVETANPRTLHVDGEFIKSNLGSALEADGSVTVRAVGQQFSFTPQCMLVPAGTPITFRATSSDVVHGFLITGTNINGMLVPGYITALPAKFVNPGEHSMPCQEFCGMGHEGMWAKVKVVDKTTFVDMAKQNRRLTCVAQ